MLVAAWRSSSGASFDLLRLLREGEFEIAVSVPLVVEYESALLRHLSGPQTEQDVTAVVDYLCLVARKQEVFFLWRPLLRDPNDDMVAELAGPAAGSLRAPRSFRRARVSWPPVSLRPQVNAGTLARPWLRT
ncbi:MAG TPA: PIN domain-containing protein [Polyangiaceae bacterium]